MKVAVPTYGTLCLAPTALEVRPHVPRDAVS